MPISRSALFSLVALSLGIPAVAAPITAGNLVIDGIPPIPARITQRLGQYQQVRGATFMDWNHDGPGMLISTRFGDTKQIHYVERPGGSRQQLTFFDEPVAGGSYDRRKGHHGLIYSADTGGGEFFQLYTYDLNDGRSTLLTDGKSRNGGGPWTHDYTRIAFSSNLRNGTDTDVRLMIPDKPGVSEVLTAEAGSWAPIEWSPDDKQLLIKKEVSANEDHLYLFELATHKLTPIHPVPGKQIAYGGVRWRHDGKGIYFVSDEDGEFKRLYDYDLKTGRKTLISTRVPWDVTGLDVAKDGRTLAFIANEDGLGKLHVMTLPALREIPLPPLPVGQVASMRFTDDGKTLGLSLATPQTPGDAYSLDLRQRTLTRWTTSEVGGLKASQFVSPELVHYPTFDQVNGKPRQIPAFYFKLPSSPKKRPVLIQIHGGPEGQAMPNFNAFQQYVLNDLGVAIVEPNVRGSTGYGKSYLAMDDGYKREDTVKDIGALLDWIAKQPELDANRVGVLGGSYGGYMTLATMTHYNDRLRAAIDTVGISNFVTFLEHTQAYRRDLRRVEYGDERDPQMRAFLSRISPTTNAGKITKPLFVVQGLNDPRVPASEAEQIVKTVRTNGGHVWYLLANDEGHGFQKKSNIDYNQRAMALFWETFLLGGS